MLAGASQKWVVCNRGHGYTYSLHSAEVALQESIRAARLVRNQPETQPTTKTLNSNGANPISLGSGNIRSKHLPQGCETFPPGPVGGRGKSGRVGRNESPLHISSSNLLQSRHRTRVGLLEPSPYWVDGEHGIPTSKVGTRLGP